MIEPLLCLATAVFFEARGEPIDGKELVANVIINRVESNKYPDTICEVVNQRKQFSYTHDGMSDNPLKYNSYHDSIAWEESLGMAEYVLDTGVINSYIIMYHNTDVDPYWTDSYSLSGKVGKHLFYRQQKD